MREPSLNMRVIITMIVSSVAPGMRPEHTYRVAGGLKKFSTVPPNYNG